MGLSSAGSTPIGAADSEVPLNSGSDVNHGSLSATSVVVLPFGDLNPVGNCVCVDSTGVCAPDRGVPILN